MAKEDKIPKISEYAKEQPPGASSSKMSSKVGIPQEGKMSHEHFQDKMNKALCK